MLQDIPFIFENAEVGSFAKLNANSPDKFRPCVCVCRVVCVIAAEDTSFNPC